MPAYLIAEHIVTDAAKFEEYRTKVGPMMASMAGVTSPKAEPINCLKVGTGNQSGL